VKFFSPEPEVKLTRYFKEPYKSIITAARTCYSSSGIIEDDKIKHNYKSLVTDLHSAGHHTTIQHAQFQFTISNISRHAVWSFLHSHPFYNSEQVSQRYVTVKPRNVSIPPLSTKGRSIYEGTILMQMNAYENLKKELIKPTSDEYFKRFPGRIKISDKYEKEIEKKSQEIARYVLPISTFTYLYHTVSALTVLRYHRICNLFDAPFEQKIIAEKMAAELLKIDPDYQIILEEPIDISQLPEYQVLNGNTTRNPAEFRKEFDESLENKTSRLIDYKIRNQESIADSVREILGLTKSVMDDNTAIELAVSPARNSVFGEKLNLSTHDKLTRAMHHASYTFRKKISHTADSQDQRHRMTPGSRPILVAHMDTTPDYETPALINESKKASSIYAETMDQTWDAIAKLRSLNESDEFIAYLLPNAVSIRFTESSDLLNLHHKHAMRLCYLAQEEIWKASLEEALQITEVNPIIGKYLLPPCTLRKIAGSKPFCPEGKRYCGEPVWNFERKNYRRII